MGDERHQARIDGLQFFNGDAHELQVFGNENRRYADERDNQPAERQADRGCQQTDAAHAVRRSRRQRLAGMNETPDAGGLSGYFVGLHQAQTKPFSLVSAQRLAALNDAARV